MSFRFGWAAKPYPFASSAITWTQHARPLRVPGGMHAPGKAIAAVAAAVVALALPATAGAATRLGVPTDAGPARGRAGHRAQREYGVLPVRPRRRPGAIAQRDPGLSPAPARDRERGDGGEVLPKRLPYVVWYGSDASGGTQGLANVDGTLRSNGDAFRAYALGHPSAAARASAAAAGT